MWCAVIMFSCVLYRAIILVPLARLKFSIRSELTVGPSHEGSRTHEGRMIATNSMILNDLRQTGLEDSFVGGKPKLPASMPIPQCSLCGADQTFFFQVAFPADHAWTERSLAVFACTSCADRNHLIPEMLPGALSGANIPATFLSMYQRNFRFEVFSTSAGRTAGDYEERIKFRGIRLERGNGPSIGQVGGMPIWVLEDESPRTYDSTTRMSFLLQVSSGIEFETVQGAPPQMEVGLTGDPEPSPYDFYELFIGNTIYLFGTDSPTVHVVYALTQVD